MAMGGNDRDTGNRERGFLTQTSPRREEQTRKNKGRRGESSHPALGRMWSRAGSPLRSGTRDLWHVKSVTKPSGVPEV